MAITNYLAQQLALPLVLCGEAPERTVYPHIADQPGVFHPEVIACSVREAVDVLDGLLANGTILRPKEHFVDQHGYPDQLFGLCHLLGYSLMPRLDVGQQKPD